MNEFSENFQRGGGVIFNPKIYVADFGPLYRAFFKHNFPKMRWGVQWPLGFFSKIHRLQLTPTLEELQLCSCIVRYFSQSSSGSKEQKEPTPKNLIPLNLLAISHLSAIHPNARGAIASDSHAASDPMQVMQVMQVIPMQHCSNCNPESFACL